MNLRITRLWWISFGFATQLLFLVLVGTLIWFMQFAASRPPVPGATASPMDGLIDGALVLLFGVPHSIFLAPPVRRALSRILPKALYGCWFCLLSCVTLWLLMWWWRPLPGIVWSIDGWGAVLVLAGAGVAWAGLGYSMWLSGLGYQTGLTGLLAYVRREPEPPRRFAVRGLYRFFRHPIYLSFLLIAWITPVMSSAHLILSVGMTVYILVGSWLKDRRLTGFIGQDYRDYMARVPGYPLGLGPWGRISQPSP